MPGVWGVEVEDELIGLVELAQAAEERVQLDTGLVGEVDQSCRFVADDLAVHSAMFRHLRAGHPLREWPGAFFCRNASPLMPSG